MLGLRDVARALEHDVLEKMGEARLAGLLVLRADVIPDVDGHHGREVVLRDDEAEAVGQTLVGELDRRDGSGRHADSWAMGCRVEWCRSYRVGSVPALSGHDHEQRRDGRRREAQ